MEVGGMTLGAVVMAVGLTGGGCIMLPGVYAGWVVCGYGSGVYVLPWVAGARSCGTGFVLSGVGAGGWVACSCGSGSVGGWVLPL